MLWSAKVRSRAQRAFRERFPSHASRAIHGCAAWRVVAEALRKAPVWLPACRITGSLGACPTLDAPGDAGPAASREIPARGTSGHWWRIASEKAAWGKFDRSGCAGVSAQQGSILSLTLGRVARLGPGRDPVRLSIAGALARRYSVRTGRQLTTACWYSETQCRVKTASFVLE